MLKNKYKYIICDENKAPIHSFDSPKKLSDVKDCENLGIVVENPYVVIDIDDNDDFEIVKKIIKELNIKTRILKTDRGGHFWFKTPEPMKNVVHSNTPLTVSIDVKCWGKKTMEIVKREGEWRKWLQEDETVDEIPFFLLPMDTSKRFYGMSDGDGRNDALFSFIHPLAKMGLLKEQVSQLFDLINRYMFADPLPQREIDAIINSNNSFESPEMMFYEAGRLLHDKLADYMIKRYNIKYYGKSMYYFDGRAYVSNDDMIKAKMIELIPYLKVSNVKEVFENIKLKVLIRPEKLNTDYINVENGLLNVHTLELIPHSPTIFNINKLDVTFDPNAKCDMIDKFLDSIAVKRQNYINLLCEMLGYVLIPDCRFQKAFILVGNGSNGKSVFLDLIRSLIGEENCSSLALEDLQDKFRVAEIVGTLLNIGDDSGHNLLENTAVFKKLVTGDSITVERKNQQPFKYSNTSKMIFAANSLPPTTDKSDGFFRRCIIIPFDNVFKPGMEGYDPCLIYKITTPEAKSYLLNLALAGLRKLMERQAFDETDDSKLLLRRYIENNNSVLVWTMDVNKKFVNDAEAYSSYVVYCATNGYKPVNIGKFKIEYEKHKKGLL